MTKFERTVLHIRTVQAYMNDVIHNFQYRSLNHDLSKLKDPERSAYEGLDEHLAGVEFGTDEYQEKLKEHLGPALQHHYERNPHHPEHYKGGIKWMSLFDLLEMLCDLRAVCDDKGKLKVDLEVTKKVHDMSDEMYGILKHTLEEMGW